MIRSLLPITLAGLLAVSLAATGADDERVERSALPVVIGELQPPASTNPPIVVAPTHSAWETPPTPAQARALRELSATLEQGHASAARQLARDLAPTLPPRARDATWLADGLLAVDEGRWDEADASLAAVADGDGPLAPWATFHRAEIALHRPDRPDPAVAVSLCSAYAERWPGGPHADVCYVTLARAWAALGRADEARAAAESWRRLHPREPVSEQVELALASAHPAEHAESLRRLAVDFTAPLTGRLAGQLLATLGESVPTTGAAARTRAESLRDAGAVDAAWRAFEAIAADPDPEAQAWARRELTPFAWKARAWRALDDNFQAAWDAAPNADVAWDAWRAASRGGLYVEARQWMQRGLSAWPTRSPWRDNTESFARTLLLGGWPTEAAALLDPSASDVGSTGRRRLFLASFARWRAGDAAGAAVGFTRLIDRGGAYEEEARYWRARAVSTSDPFTAEADRAWILGHEPDGWYAVLLRTDTTAPGPIHRGGWPALTTPAWWPVVPLDAQLPGVSPAFGAAHVGAPAVIGAPGLAAPVRLGGPPAAPAVWRPPLGYPEGPYHDAESAQARLDALADGWGARWPVLEAIADLSRVGLHDLSGPLMAEWYGEWRRALGRRDPSARSLSAEIGDAGLLPAFFAARDHHHTAKRTWLLDRHVTDAAARDATERLAWPVAHGRVVWEGAEAADLDPWLVLSLMRAESTYNPVAVSRVGARGPMQIMPRTGFLIADLVGDATFTPSDLYDPVTAVDFGIRYLGLLRERFDGVFPLAVAAYNAGPHNVGAWLDGMGPGAPIDEVVEAIPFVETRDYVRKVTAGYDAYTRLYEGRGVRVPLQTKLQDRSVVDF